AHIPDVHVGVNVAQARLFAEKPRPAITELDVDPVGMRAQLVAHLWNRCFHGFDVEFGSAQLLAVLAEVFRYLVGESAEHEIHGVLKKSAIAPHAKAPSETAAGVGEKSGKREAAFEFTDDDLGVAIDIGPDLQYRSAPVTAGHRHQVRTWHDARDQHRAPGEPLDAEHDAHFFGER